MEISNRIGKLNKVLTHCVIPAGTVIWLLKALHLIPELSQLCSSSMFVFFLCNAIVVALATDCGLLSTNTRGGRDSKAESMGGGNETEYRGCVPETFLVENEIKTADEVDACEELKCIRSENQDIGGKSGQPKLGLSKSENSISAFQERARQRVSKLRRFETVDKFYREDSWEEIKSRRSSGTLSVVERNPPAAQRVCEAPMVDEELNSKVEGFLSKFNRQMSLQRLHSFAAVKKCWLEDRTNP